MSQNELQEEFRQVAEEYRKFEGQFKDPVLIGTLLTRLTDERTRTNVSLREIHAKIDRLMVLEERVARLENAIRAQQPASTTSVNLSEVDDSLVAFVRERGRVCAEDVQERFSYKGRNGASSRLNRLFEKGLLEKAQAGKKVFYAVRRT